MSLVNSPLRVVIAVLTLLVQGLVLSHSALVEHTVSASGLIVEGQHEHAGHAQHAEASWCSDVAPPEFGDLCVVWRSARFAMLGTPFERSTPIVTAPQHTSFKANDAHPPHPVLVTAPKASPPVS